MNANCFGVRSFSNSTRAPSHIFLLNKSIFETLILNLISTQDGDWDCEDLIALFEKMLENQKSFKRFYVFLTLIPKLMHKTSVLLFNMQSKSQAVKDISAHYDIGNDLYRLMLDRSMNYSCGYWQKNVPINSRESKGTLCATVDEAQMNKMLLIGKKLNLKPGMRVLDIGCGWGYLAKFLAINFGIFKLFLFQTFSKFDSLSSNQIET